MYKLYFDETFLTNLSSFDEFIERSVENDDASSACHLSLFVKDTDIENDFNLDRFLPYMQENSIQSISIEDLEGKVIYKTTYYNKIHDARWFLDDDTANGIDVRKIYIRCEK